MTCGDEENDYNGNECHSLPRSSLQKLIRQHASPELKLSADLVVLIGKCCTAADFVEMVCSTANEVSASSKKATISPDHIIIALEQLEMPEFREPVTLHMQEWKDDNKINQARLKKKSVEKCNLTEEEQIEMQRRLFEEARQHAAAMDP